MASTASSPPLPGPSTGVRPGPAHRAGRPGLISAWVFAAAVGLAAINRVAGWGADREVLWAYYIIVASTVIGLLVDLLRDGLKPSCQTSSSTSAVTKARAHCATQSVARLGDRDLVVAYWLPGEHRYVDDGGRPVDVSEVGPGRVATQVRDDGEPLAVLLHDAAVLDDPRLVAAVAEGVRLAVSNAGMQAATRERIDALMASRRRIVEAGDAQRQRLAGDLRDRVQGRLDTVAELIEKLRRDTDGLPLDFPDEFAADLAEAQSELADFAQGLHPRVLIRDGLAAAISALPVDLTARLNLLVCANRLDPSIEATIYFVCAEALTNIAKYAGAANVSVQVHQDDGSVTATIEDDGIGGADQTAGIGPAKPYRPRRCRRRAPHG